jgi:hypothetical protein
VYLHSDSKYDVNEWDESAYGYFFVEKKDFEKIKSIQEGESMQIAERLRKGKILRALEKRLYDLSLEDLGFLYSNREEKFKEEDIKYKIQDYEQFCQKSKSDLYLMEREKRRKLEGFSIQETEKIKQMVGIFNFREDTKVKNSKRPEDLAYVGFNSKIKKILNPMARVYNDGKTPKRSTRKGWEG